MQQPASYICNLANKRLNSLPLAHPASHTRGGSLDEVRSFSILRSWYLTWRQLTHDCRTMSGWEPISTDGPQLLPASSGGATAYKFRDPEGHPLELIAFARDAVPVNWQEPSASGCLGIDHSAISIADTERSVRFYERLGLQRIGGSLNSGPEQDKLDNVSGALIEVTALAPPRFSVPHIELLCYRSHSDQQAALLGTNDLAATRLVLAVRDDEIDALCAQNTDALLSGPVRFEKGELRAMLRDPDGHLLCLEAS